MNSEALVRHIEALLGETDPERILARVSDLVELEKRHTGDIQLLLRNRNWDEVVLAFHFTLAKVPYLLEVLHDFPGDAADELFLTETPGGIAIVFGSPDQFLSALKRQDHLVLEAKKGTLVFDDHSETASELKHWLESLH